MTHGKLEKGESNKHRCTCCNKAMPIEMPRVNFQNQGRWGKTFTRICAPCIKKYAQEADEIKFTDESERIMKKPF